MVTETSDLDAMKGIAYRGLSLYECNKQLPKADGGEVGLPEASFWLLLTGEVPSDAECKAFTEEIHRRATVPQYAMAIIDALPKDMHPMTQIATSMLALQKESLFTKAYDSGMKKGEYWEYALEDAMNLTAQIPVVAAKIYRKCFKDGKMIPYDSKMDWAGNYSQMLGVTQDPMFKEATRLYLMLHADHEGGNVSAHTWWARLSAIPTTRGPPVSADSQAHSTAWRTRSASLGFCRCRRTSAVRSQRPRSSQNTPRRLWQPARSSLALDTPCCATPILGTCWSANSH